MLVALSALLGSLRWRQVAELPVLGPVRWEGQQCGLSSTSAGQRSGSLLLEKCSRRTCPCANVFQHAMVIDSRNSSILPRRGALLKVNQVESFHCGLSEGNPWEVGSHRVVVFEYSSFDGERESMAGGAGLRWSAACRVRPWFRPSTAKAEAGLGLPAGTASPAHRALAPVLLLSTVCSSALTEAGAGTGPW